ncbi:DNA/RNA non-specific endonuclease [Paraburkholderia sp. BCC1884]|uniref:DNA/RNA non-specific endonuclease n=1 Tax=Paraburkholderia sp. BCC1884 TaxID=2562668 RepID=UPI001642CAA8|nr:DNA/RNA non-specific endonuclease [Paraburkholderia sp. BCC1884]
MANQERIRALRARLTPEMECAVCDAIANKRLPVSLMHALPQSSLDALEKGQSFGSVADTATQSFGDMEAIVALVGRPSLLIRNDKVVMQKMPELPRQTPGLILGVQKWIPSVGRIEFHNNDMAWGGTGWVAERWSKGALVVTNRHVARIVARRKADGSAVFMRSPSGARYGAAIDFGEEVASRKIDHSRTAELSRVQYLADDTSADVALLRIETADFELPEAFRLIEDERKLAEGELVALIGYPAYDSRNDADAQARYFRDIYEVKRFAPGKILQAPGDGILTYDCTSLGGNSGSPVIRLEDGKVAGLHFSGIYGKANSAVSARTIGALLKGQRPVSVALRGEGEEARDGSHPAAYFAGRAGLDTDFLKSHPDAQPVATPWPGIPAHWSAGLAEPADNPPEPNELRYTHFGIKYSAALKLPLITAVNLDGAASVRVKRGNDKWFADERIPRSVQLNAQNFRDAEIDRGHMVRREDPVWGSPGDAQQANDDTFHYTNAAAQHSRLNQDKSLWQGLENYILDNARTHGFQACVFTGPVLRDPEGDEEEIVIDGAIVPIEFWKVVATLDASDKTLHATAYVLSQGQLIRKLLEKRSRAEALEGFVLGAYRTFQVAISDLADATGYDFSAYVAADPLARNESGREALRSGEPLVLPLDKLADIIL